MEGTTAAYLAAVIVGVLAALSAPVLTDLEVAGRDGMPFLCPESCPGGAGPSDDIGAS